MSDLTEFRREAESNITLPDFDRLAHRGRTRRRRRQGTTVVAAVGAVAAVAFGLNALEGPTPEPEPAKLLPEQTVSPTERERARTLVNSDAADTGDVEVLGPGRTLIQFDHACQVGSRARGGESSDPNASCAAWAATGDSGRTWHHGELAEPALSYPITDRLVYLRTEGDEVVVDVVTGRREALRRSDEPEVLDLPHERLVQSHDPSAVAVVDLATWTVAPLQRPVARHGGLQPPQLDPASKRIWQIGARNKLMYTSDGGTSWTAVPRPADLAFGVPQLVTSGKRLALISGEPILWLSDDLGNSWVKAKLPDAPAGGRLHRLADGRLILLTINRKLSIDRTFVSRSATDWAHFEPMDERVHEVTPNGVAVRLPENEPGGGAKKTVYVMTSLEEGWQQIYP